MIIKDIEVIGTKIENDKIENNNLKNKELTDLLLLAKNNDSNAKEKLINKYYGLIVYHSKGIFLSGYSFDDLVQTGIVSLLKAIENFDIDKGIGSFNSYVFWCIKNNFNYLCRQEIKHNKCYSLNTIVKDNMESVDFIAAAETLEEIIFKKITCAELKASLSVLDPEELELISFLYLNYSSEKKPFLSNYAKLKCKDYYYCTLLKKRALKKLKSFQNLN